MSQSKKRGSNVAIFNKDIPTKLPHVAPIMLLIGQILFPYVSHELTGMQFQTWISHGVLLGSGRFASSRIKETR
jgi:hypothetical protein